MGCAKKCKKNSSWTLFPDFCEKTCENINIPCRKPAIPGSPPIPGCECNKGFVNDLDKHTCIPISSCAKKCKKNSSWTLFPDFCEKTCENINIPCRKPAIPGSPPIPGCECN